ncbi:MAG: hypothetical protein O8C66_02705 [Candidatus Methanoperedens sp.]|nr:hypothetical protein [Candidatus Methanoperedens sp.]
MKFLKVNYSTLQRMVQPLDKNIKNQKKREIIEETKEKLDIRERDLKNLERIKKELWKK